MAPRNISFSPSPSPLTQLDTPTSSNPEQPVPSSSFLPPLAPPLQHLPPPPPPAPASKAKKKKPSAKAAGTEGEDATTQPSTAAPKGGKGKGKAAAVGAAGGPPVAGKGSRGGKKGAKAFVEVAEPSNKYKDKFVELRTKYDEINSTKDANLAILVEALSRLRKVQGENDAFLSSFVTNVHTHPSLAYYLERSKTPPLPSLSLPAAPLVSPTSNGYASTSQQPGLLLALQDSSAFASLSNQGDASTSSMSGGLHHARDETNGYHEDERSMKRARIE